MADFKFICTVIAILRGNYSEDKKKLKRQGFISKLMHLSYLEYQEKVERKLDKQKSKVAYTQ